jgi:hypothetical protein
MNSRLQIELADIIDRAARDFHLRAQEALSEAPRGSMARAMAENFTAQIGMALAALRFAVVEKDYAP